MDFRYLTGLPRRIFGNARLTGDWNGWAEIAMNDVTADDGCPAFAATVGFDDAEAGRVLRWGVRLDGPQGANVWGICTEVAVADSQERSCEVRLPAAGGSGEAQYLLTWGRYLGAQKTWSPQLARPGLRLAVWAPSARTVEVVFGLRDKGYIAPDGAGIDPGMPTVPLARGPGDIWRSDPQPDFGRFAGAPYMFRIEDAQGRVLLRTDIYSRWQAGRGGTDPAGGAWDGDPRTLDGTVSCSVVIDPDLVREEFEPTTSPPRSIGDGEFWRDEFSVERPVPTRVEDLVIYELHVGALGYPRTGPGTLADAMRLLDHLEELGVTAVELMPLAEFSGAFSWGYGNTHHFAIESSAGGRDKYKHFVRECHRRGIAVIQDVVYNHFDQTADRAEWQYDSSADEENIYYWYEGRSTDYPQPSGGYVENGSSGDAPRYWAEPVRRLFVGSALQLVEEFHVDGLRVDLTQAMHRDNRRRADQRSVGSANLFGQKALREWSRTLHMVRPSVMLIAEDHSGWDAVTQPPAVGGLGFDATWFAEFYHHLVGDSDMAAGAARLLRDAGLGDDRPLRLEDFARALWRTQFGTITYHESHDEAGNATGSARTAAVAVGGAPLWGLTRQYAEARCRVAVGVSILSAGTPMFFMGEEVVAQKSYRYDNVDDSKEDLFGERSGAGAAMFRFYQDLIRLRRANAAVRSRHIDIVHVDGRHRVIAFTRRAGDAEVLVVASLNNHPFLDGYVLQTDGQRLPSGMWQETFNSDSYLYGGQNVGNVGAAIPAAAGRLQLRLPSNGLLVLHRR
jgi:1,4-alpha-glucan branching enzyme